MKKILPQKNKIALVLGGGGIKAAAYHLGVCLALQEKGFTFVGGAKEIQESHRNEKWPIKLYVGSSAGAFVAAVLASGKSVESLINAFQVGAGDTSFYKTDFFEKLKPLGYRHIFNINSQRIFSLIPGLFFEKSLFSGGLEALLKKGFKLNGLFNTQGIERYLRKYILDENDFQRLGVELYIVATQLNHPSKVVFGPYYENKQEPQNTTTYVSNSKISEAVAASTALPPVFAPYLIQTQSPTEEYYLYDGEIRDTLSTHVATDNGADLVISSFSMQPYRYSKDMGSLHKFGIPAIINQALYQVLEQKVSRHIQYQSQKKSLYQEVQQLCSQYKLSSEITNELLLKIESKLQFKNNVESIYISPRPQYHEMFFADHFSLNPKILEKIVRIGFKSAISELKKYDFT